MKKLNLSGLCFLALAAVLNLVGANLALALRLPIYLDSMGTMLGAALLGPVYGMLPGAVKRRLKRMHYGCVRLLLPAGAAGHRPAHRTGLPSVPPRRRKRYAADPAGIPADFPAGNGHQLRHYRPGLRRNHLLRLHSAGAGCSHGAGLSLTASVCVVPGGPRTSWTGSSVWSWQFSFCPPCLSPCGGRSGTPRRSPHRKKERDYGTVQPHYQ